MSVITLTEEHFDESKTNGRFVLYLHATNKRVGEKVHNHTYTAWIAKHVADFKKQEGVAYLDKPEVQARFDEYLKSQIEVQQISLF